MGSKGSQTTTQSTSNAPNPQALAAYQNLLTNAGNVGQIPFTAYTPSTAWAGLTPEQQLAQSNINQYAEVAQPLYGSAANLITGAASPLTTGEINKYYSPYQQDVVASTENWLNNLNQQQLQTVKGNAVAQGALGGDREAVAEAATAGQQAAAEAPTIAGLENTGYQSALTTAAQQFQQNPMMAAYGLGNVGAGMQSAALQGAGAQFGAGNTGYQQSYAQYLMQQGYPFQVASWMAGIDTGVGSQMGGTSLGTTVAPPPNLFGQIAGLGVAGAGAAGMLGWKPFAADGGRIEGYADGGGPFGGAGYVPAPAGLGHPSNMPPMSAPKPAQQPSGMDIFNNAVKMASNFSGNKASLSLTPTPTPTLPIPTTDQAPAPSDQQLAGGGSVPYPGGMSLPARNRINLPMRAGLGMPSFVRKGYDAGGSPNDYVQANWPSNDIFDDVSSKGNRLEPSYVQDPQANDYVKSHWPQFDINRDPDSGDIYQVPEGLSPQRALAVLMPQGQPDEDGGQEAISNALADNGSGNNFGLASSYSSEPGSGGLYAPPAPPPTRAPSSQYTAPELLPGQGKPSGFLGLTPEGNMGLIAMGLGMASAASRPGATFAGSVGEGGLAGLGTYAGYKNKEADIDLKVKHLQQLERQEQDRMRQEGERNQIMREQLASQEKLRQFQEGKVEIVHTILGDRPVAAGPDGIRHYLDTGEPVIGPTTPTEAPRSDDESRPFMGTKNPSVATATKAQEMGLHGQAFLDSLPPLVAKQVEAVGNYDAPITVFSKMGRAGMSQNDALAMVRQFNPDYDTYWATAHGASLKEFLAGGPSSPASQVTSYNTAIGHAGDAYDALQEMKRINPGILQEVQNAGVPFLSYAAAQLQNKAIQGTPMGVALNKYVTAMTLYGSEVSKLYTGSVGSQEERNTVRLPLDPNKSLPEVEAGLQTSVHMMGSRAGALEDRYKVAQDAPGLSQYGTKGPLKDFPVIHERAKAVLDKIGGATEKTVKRTGTVNSGPNAGKKIIEYTDGTTEYR